MIKVIDKNVMPKSFGNKGIKEVYKGDSLLWEIKEKIIVKLAETGFFEFDGVLKEGRTYHFKIENLQVKSGMSNPLLVFHFDFNFITTVRLDESGEATWKCTKPVNQISTGKIEFNGTRMIITEI